MLDVVGSVAGLLGVTLAIYLQLINPRRCHPGHVMALFAGGSALIMVFSAAWVPNHHAVMALKAGSIILFVSLEAVGAYYVWKQAEVAPAREVIASLFTSEQGPL